MGGAALDLTERRVNIGLDAYTRNARLKPALLAWAPAAWTVMAWSPNHALGWGGFWGVVVAIGGTVLLSQLARDRGKRREPDLFDAHGGRPTELLLSHLHAPNKVALAMRHAKLRRLLPHVRIPSEAEELSNASAANEVYAACVGQVISRTRDDRMLLQENINYGFRRNLWGLKPLGIIVSTSGAIVLGLLLFRQFSSDAGVSPLIAVFEASNVVMLLLWVFFITPAWVMVPARAYAERLFEALDRLAVD